MLNRLKICRMERFVYIRDSDSTNILKDNTPCKFKVQLNLPLTFDGFWKVALCEISLQVSAKTHTKNKRAMMALYRSTG